MISTTIGGNPGWIIDNRWDNGTFRMDVSVHDIATGTSLSMREGRRPHGTSLYVDIVSFATTANQEAAWNVEAFLRVYQNQPVACPLWPAMTTWANRANVVIKTGMLLVCDPDFTNWELYPVATEPSGRSANDWVFPALIGRLEKRRVNWIETDLATWDVEFVERSDFGLGILERGADISVGTVPDAAWPYAPLKFPLPVQGKAGNEDFSSVTYREQLGFGRIPMETTYTQTSVREMSAKPVMSCDGAAQAIEFFRQVGTGYAFWVPLPRECARLTATASAGATSLVCGPVHAVGVGDWLALLDGCSPSWNQTLVSAVSGGTLTVSAIDQAATLGKTVIAPLVLARMKEPRITVEWLDMECATVSFLFRECPPEYVPAADEVYGETLGRLCLRVFLYEFSRTVGGVTEYLRLTSHEQECSFESHTWTPAKLGHGTLRKGSALDVDTVEVQAALGAAGWLDDAAGIKNQSTISLRIIQAEDCSPPGLPVRWALISERLSAGVLEYAGADFNAFYRLPDGGVTQRNLHNKTDQPDHHVYIEFRKNLKRVGGFPVVPSGDGVLSGVNGGAFTLSFTAAAPSVSRTGSFAATGPSDPNGGPACGRLDEICVTLKSNVRSSTRYENLAGYSVIANVGSELDTTYTFPNSTSSTDRSVAVVWQSVPSFDGTVDFGGPTGNAGSGFSSPGLTGSTETVVVFPRTDAAHDDWKYLTGAMGASFNLAVSHVAGAITTEWTISQPVSYPASSSHEWTNPPYTPAAATGFFQILTTAGCEVSSIYKRKVSEGQLQIAYPQEFGVPRKLDGFVRVSDNSLIRMGHDFGSGSVNGYGHFGTGYDPIYPTVLMYGFKSQNMTMPGPAFAFKVNPEGLNPAVTLPATGKIRWGVIADRTFVDYADKWKHVILKVTIDDPLGTVAPIGNPGNLYQVPNSPILEVDRSTLTRPGGYTVTTVDGGLPEDTRAVISDRNGLTVLSAPYYGLAFSEGGTLNDGTGFTSHVYGRPVEAEFTFRTNINCSGIKYENTTAAHGVTVKIERDAATTFTIDTDATAGSAHAQHVQTVTAYDGVNNFSGTSGFGSASPGIVVSGTNTATKTYNVATAPAGVWDALTGFGPDGPVYEVAVTRAQTNTISAEISAGVPVVVPPYTFTEAVGTTTVTSTITFSAQPKFRYENSNGYLVIWWPVRLGLPRATTGFTRVSDGSTIAIAPLGTFGTIDVNGYGVEEVAELYVNGGEPGYAVRSLDRVWFGEDWSFQINT